MNAIIAIVILVAAGAAAWLIMWRRAQRHVVTQETLRCPLHDCRATVAVRTDPHAGAGRRYLAVAGCSLHPPAPHAPHARVAHFADFGPGQSYLCDACEPPRLAEGVPCTKSCLVALNAAENGARPLEPLGGDAWELGRRTQPPAVMRALWLTAP
jgi:hypothetical protein